MNTSSKPVLKGSPVVRSPTRSRSITFEGFDQQSIDSNIAAGDPNAAGLYKARSVPKVLRIYGKCGKYNVSQIAQCWAFTNLVVCLLDWLFSLCEVVVYTSLTGKGSNFTENIIKIEAPMHRYFYLMSAVIHGDCKESLVEIVFTFTVELVYLVSSVLFAFSTYLVDKEDYKVVRCSVQWLVFSVWMPLFSLLPRLLLNVVGTCGSHSLQLYNPKSHSQAPRIVFWVANIIHGFFLALWLMRTRLVALSFLDYKQEEFLKQSVKMTMVQSASADDLLSISPSNISHLGGARDKAYRKSAMGAFLPQSISLG